jgi:Plasmid pRiA4b ORF-3-like protein
MGWTDSHLHQFIVGHMYYGVPDPEWGNEVKNEKRIRLAQIVTAVKTPTFSITMLWLDGGQLNRARTEAYTTYHTGEGLGTDPAGSQGR